MFQKTIISKYLKTQNKENLINQWDLFCAHFHNPEIQENIRNSKEEQYQEGFLRDLFVKVFGYTLNPTIGFNLTTEYKNIKDSKKADGAIIIDENVVGVIELKGTNTTDLGKVEEQAFNYKNNQTGCAYVITSNFEKLRLYIDDSVRFIEFNLFTLKQDDFNLLYLLLSFENIKNNVPKKLKDESLNQEDIVTKKLYKDYSIFKRELFQNLTALNPEYDPLELFQKSQKLLDRLLFLLFGEDRGLLPPNSVRQILEQWDKLKDLDAYDPLYNRYKKYFGYLNTGFKGKNHDVFAYNGGLFKEDEILDHVKIDDDILYEHTFRLSQYDFASEVDVNILGHIFENSLNEIDEIKAQLDGTEIDKTKTKRKKDGVFYTPKYITKYIVENTVGKLCEEKKTEFQIVEEEYFTDKKRQQRTKENLLCKLDQYRKWLLQITIIDPACGSGAFLNESLNFLIEEHQYVDELEAKLLNVPIIFSYHSESILENNLFGVDLNEESVEIAKLSLWLRTAEPNRKLNSLNDNIKCGNSLIDDPEIAGDKSFNWREQFPRVFAKGGFDVVIGNPPYVVYKKSTNGAKLIDAILANYTFAEYNPNTYALFTELSIQTLLKSSGYLGLIIPNTWLTAQFFSKMRKGIYSKNIKEIVYLKNTAFQEVVETVILIAHNSNKIPETILLTDNLELKQTISSHFNYDRYCGGFNPFITQDSPLLKKLEEKCLLLGENAIIYRGLETRNNSTYISTEKKTETYKPILLGKDVNRYGTSYSGSYVNFIKSEMKSNANESYYNQPKILMRRTGATIIASIDNQNLFALKNLYLIIPNNSEEIFSMISQLNSSLIAFFHRSKSSDENKAFAQFQGSYVCSFPYKKSSDPMFRVNVEKLESLHTSKRIHSEKFRKNMSREFSLEIISKKLENWHQLAYADFLRELKKQKVELSLSQKADWEQYFDQEKDKAIEIQSQIIASDRKIDQMVYQLYGLSEEEIAIVERQS